jgi:hypothetical protein
MALPFRVVISLSDQVVGGSPAAKLVLTDDKNEWRQRSGGAKLLEKL